MIKKVKNFIAITILTALALIFFIASAGMFATALKVMKTSAAAIPAALLILVAFVLSLGVSAILAIIDLPLTIVSIKKSEKKVYPTILVVIESIIIIAALIFLIVLLVNVKK